MGKVYRTSSGRTVDMDALASQNADEIAIGNMGVNAAGDKLGKGGIVIQTSNERVQGYHKDTSKSTKRSVSVKGKGNDEVVVDGLDKTTEDVVSEDPAPKAKAKPKSKAKKTNTVEKELPDGSIEIVDVPDGETPDE